jgi:hypothetical protein
MAHDGTSVGGADSAPPPISDNSNWAYISYLDTEIKAVSEGITLTYQDSGDNGPGGSMVNCSIVNHGEDPISSGNNNGQCIVNC